MDFVGLFGFISDAVGSELTAIVDWATTGFSTLFGDIVSVGGVLGSFIDWVKGALNAIVAFLRGFWDWLKNISLKGIIDWIKRHWDALKRWLKQIKKNLDLYKRNLQDMWNLYVKPFMDFIQRLRRALFIFRLLGFQWAKDLDAYLVKLENKINRAFLGAFQNLNILADWINFILDPLGLWSSNIWLGAIKQSAGAIWAIIWGTPASGLPGTPNPGNTAGVNLYTPTQQKVRVDMRAALGGITPEDAYNANAVIAGWQRLGYPISTV